MEPGDLPALWRLAAAQNRRDGTSYPFPPVFEMDGESPRFGRLVENAALALVTEVRSPNGEWRVRMGHVFLRTIEAMSFGGGEGDMKFSAAHIPLASEALKQRGYIDLHSFVPKGRATTKHILLLEESGLNRVDHRLAHFFRML